MPPGVPVAPVAFLEPDLDLNGNVVEGVPTIPRTGAGDGRGIHSDQSQDSSGQGTSLTSSTDSSGPQSVSVSPSFLLLFFLSLSLFRPFVTPTAYHGTTIPKWVYFT